MSQKKLSLLTAICIAVYVGEAVFGRIRYSGTLYGGSAPFMSFLQPMLLLPLAAYFFAAAKGEAASPADPRSDSKYWVAALAAPVVGFGFGLGFLFLSRPAESDWLGLTRIFPAGVGMILGCTASAVFSLVSWRREERFSVVAMLAGLPSAAWVIWAVAPWLRALTCSMLGV